MRTRIVQAGKRADGSDGQRAARRWSQWSHPQVMLSHGRDQRRCTCPPPPPLSSCAVCSSPRRLSGSSDGICCPCETAHSGPTTRALRSGPLPSIQPPARTHARALPSPPLNHTLIPFLILPSPPSPSADPLPLPKPVLVHSAYGCPDHPIRCQRSCRRSRCRAARRRRSRSGTPQRRRSHETMQMQITTRIPNRRSLRRTRAGHTRQQQRQRRQPTPKPQRRLPRRRVRMRRQ